MKLTSPVFAQDGEIPKRYTGEGENVSPPLNWSKVPEGVREFAIFCEDPDAPVREGRDHPFVHWIIYNISPTMTMLPEGIVAELRVEAPVRCDQGTNSFGEVGYGGPMPPVGHGLHHYRFRLYALNLELALPPGATKAEFLKAIEGHVIEQALLIGTYRRDAKSQAG
jgi:Raf kinase inhibitor-like YbhB/YbcL family protein